MVFLFAHLFACVVHPLFLGQRPDFCHALNAWEFLQGHALFARRQAVSPHRPSRQLRRVLKFRQSALHIGLPDYISRIHLSPNFPHLLLREHHLRSTNILLKIPNPLRPRNNHHILPLRNQPRQTELRRRAPLPRRLPPQPLDEPQIPPKVPLAEPRQAPPEIPLGEVVPRPQRARQEPAPQRAVADDRDPQLAARRQHAAPLGRQLPRAVLDLRGVDGGDGVRAPKRRRGGARYADGLDLSLPGFATFW